MLGGLPPEGDLTAIHPVDPGISSRSRSARDHGGPRYETQLHETKGDVFREFQGIDHPRLTLLEVGEGEGGVSRPSAMTTSSSPGPSSPSEPTSGSHQANYLVENHFQPQDNLEATFRPVKDERIGSYGQPAKISPFSHWVIL